MFYGATSFNQDISGWDVSSIGVFSNIFRNATSFDQYISVWEAGGTFSNMFNGAITGYGTTPTTVFFNYVFTPTNTQFSASIAYYFDDTDDVLLTDNNKKEIKAASGIGKWNTSGVSNMNALFQNRTNFNEDLKY